MKLKVRNSTNGSRIKISNLMTLKPDQMLLVAKANRKTQILSSFLKRICEYCKLSYGEELQFTDRCKYCDWNIHGTRYEVSATQNLDIQLSPESAEHVQSVRSRLSKSLHSSQYITPYLIPRFPHFHHQFHSDITHCTFGLKKSPSRIIQDGNYISKCNSPTLLVFLRLRPASFQLQLLFQWHLPKV